MANQPNVIVRNQFVYLLENATINVFDCVDAVTGRRDIYYIQKGRIDGAVQFRETRRTPRAQTYNQQPNWRPPHHSPSSSESSDDDEEVITPTNRTTGTATYMNTDKYIDILGSRRTVTDDELQKVSDKLRFEDDKYKKMATHLGLSYDDQDRIRKEKERRDKTEMIFTLFKLWKAQSSEPTVGKVGHALEHCGLQKFVTETLQP